MFQPARARWVLRRDAKYCKRAIWMALAQGAALLPGDVCPQRDVAVVDVAPVISVVGPRALNGRR